MLNVGERLPESQIICGEQESVPGRPCGCTASSVSCPAPWGLASTAPQKTKVLLCLQPLQGLQSLVVIASLFVFS